MLLLSGCWLSDSKQQGEAAVEVSHGQLNSGDFDAIWNHADASFRKAATRDAYDRFIGAVHRKLGRVLKTTNTG